MKLYNIYPTEVANARWLEQEEDPDAKERTTCPISMTQAH